MEVKINKEIREYSEDMFFGLTLRQFFFSALGCIVAVAIYFPLRNLIGLELTTWACVLVVIPFAAVGFLKYNGMPAEQVAFAYVKDRILYPRRYLATPVCYYYSLLEEDIKDRMGSLTEKELRAIKRRNRREKKLEDKKRKRGKR